MSLSLNQAKQKLFESINNYIQERIVYATETIVDIGVNKIVDGDVIMTFSRSYAVEVMLKRAQGL